MASVGHLSTGETRGVPFIRTDDFQRVSEVAGKVLPAVVTDCKAKGEPSKLGVREKPLLQDPIIGTTQLIHAVKTKTSSELGSYLRTEVTLEDLVHTDVLGRTALHHALLDGKEDAALLLIARGLELLHEQAQKDRTAKLELLKAQAQRHPTMNVDLMSAQIQSDQLITHVNIGSVFLNKKEGYDQLTPLLLAAYKGFYGVVDRILGIGDVAALVNTCDRQNVTLLHVLAMHHDSERFAQTVKAGASLRAKDMFQHSAHQCALLTESQLLSLYPNLRMCKEIATLHARPWTLKEPVIPSSIWIPSGYEATLLTPGKKTKD